MAVKFFSISEKMLPSQLGKTVKKSMVHDSINLLATEGTTLTTS